MLADILAQPVDLKAHQQAIFAVPFPYLAQAAALLESHRGYSAAAQNCHHKKSGAYTGEVAAQMIQSLGITNVIVGHSERREYAGEDHALLAEKVDICLLNGIIPIFCCGEPLAVREAEGQNAFVEKQLRESIFHLDPDIMEQMIIAYEPIWAIGTGRTASSEQAQEMHAHLRAVIAAQYGQPVASKVSILYGGSVKGNNAAELFACADVDGGLVGGASLNAGEFVQIISALK